MTFIIKHNLKFLFLFFFAVAYSQPSKKDSLRGCFTYLLKSKPNNLYPDYTYEELFSLQISDVRSFYISEKKLKSDSIYKNEFQKAINSNSSNIIIDMRGKSLPKTNSRFIIIQANDTVQFYDKIGTSLLSYTNPKINNWKLINETKTINSLVCKKAELNFKGRNWTAWYSTEIPFPYGPNKFGGLPGLIVKITDKKGDYDFELVKSTPSSAMKGKVITIDKSLYENPKLVTKRELREAKEKDEANIISSLESMGTIITPEQREILRQRQKKNQADKKGYNPIELEE